MCVHRVCLPTIGYSRRMFYIAALSFLILSLWGWFPAGDNTVRATEPTHTRMTVSGASVQAGGKINLRAKLEREVGANSGSYTPLSGKSVAFRIDGTMVAVSSSQSNGEASILNYTIPSNSPPGTKQIKAEFAGDSQYASSSATNNLVVKGP